MNRRDGILLVIVFMLATFVLGCSGTGPSEQLRPGAHRVTGETWAGERAFTFEVIDVSAARVVFRWTGGDVRGALPRADTASWNVDAYYVLWNGAASGQNYSLRFGAPGACEGRDLLGTGGGLDARPWSSCRIERGP